MKGNFMHYSDLSQNRLHIAVDLQQSNETFSEALLNATKYARPVIPA